MAWPATRYARRPTRQAAADDQQRRHTISSTSASATSAVQPQHFASPNLHHHQQQEEEESPLHAGPPPPAITTHVPTQPQPQPASLSSPSSPLPAAASCPCSCGRRREGGPGAFVRATRRQRETDSNERPRPHEPASQPAGVRLSPSRKQHIEHRHRTRVSSGPNALTWGEWMGDPPDAARGGPGGLVSRSAAGRRAALHGSSIGAGRTRPRHFARRTSICQPVIGLAPCGSRPERRSARHRTARLRAQRTPSFGSHHGGGVPHTAVAALDGRHWLGSRNRPCQRRSLAAVRHIAAPQVAFRHRTNARSRSGCASLAARRAPGPIFSPSAILALLSVEADVAHVVAGPFLPFFSKKGRRLRAPPAATATAAWWPSALASPGGSLATGRLRDPQSALAVGPVGYPCPRCTLPVRLGGVSRRWLLPYGLQGSDLPAHVNTQTEEPESSC